MTIHSIYTGNYVLPIFHTLYLLSELFNAELYMEGPNSLRPKKARQVKSNVKSMLFIFFDTKRTVHKEFVWEGQAVNSA
jgi:hypothetical protein